MKRGRPNATVEDSKLYTAAISPRFKYARVFAPSRSTYADRLAERLWPNLKFDDLSEASRAVISYPKNIKSWGELFAVDFLHMKLCKSKFKHKLEIYKQLEYLDVGDKEASEKSETPPEVDLKMKYSCALLSSLLKPSPFFIYKRLLRLCIAKTKEDALKWQPASCEISNQISAMEQLLNRRQKRVAIEEEMKKYFEDQTEKSFVSHSKTLPSIEEMSLHCALLERKIAEVLQTLCAKGRISKSLQGELVKLGPEQTPSDNLIEIADSNPKAFTFLFFETGILTRKFNKLVMTDYYRAPVSKKSLSLRVEEGEAEVPKESVKVGASHNTSLSLD